MTMNMLEQSKDYIPTRPDVDSEDEEIITYTRKNCRPTIRNLSDDDSDHEGSGEEFKTPSSRLPVSSIRDNKAQSVKRKSRIVRVSSDDSSSSDEDVTDLRTESSEATVKDRFSSRIVRVFSDDSSSSDEDVTDLKTKISDATVKVRNSDQRTANVISDDINASGAEVEENFGANLPADDDDCSRNNLQNVFANDDLFDAEKSDDDADASDSDENIDSSEISLNEVKQKRGGSNTTEGVTRKRRNHKNDLMELHSESQRIVRQSRVSLPYHVPQQKTLEEFLNRKKNALSSVKLSAIEVEKIIKKIEAKNQIASVPEECSVKQKLDFEKRSYASGLTVDVTDATADNSKQTIESDQDANASASAEKSSPVRVEVVEKETGKVSDPKATEENVLETNAESNNLKTNEECVKITETSISESKLSLLLKDLPPLIPKLNGEPHSVIVLDDDDNPDQPPPKTGVSGFIARFMQHTSVSQAREHIKTVKLSILKKTNDSSGENQLVMEDINVSVGMEAPNLLDVEASGSRFLKVKEHLQKQISEKRAKARMEKIKLHEMDEEELKCDGTEEEESEEEEILGDMSDSHEDTEEEEESGVPEKKEKKKKNPFIDEEAEDEDDDETDRNDDDDDDDDCDESEGEDNPTEETTLHQIKDNSQKESLDLRLETIESNDGMIEEPSSKVNPLARYATEELFPEFLSTSRSEKSEGVPNENNASKTHNLNRTIELLESLIPTCQSGGGLQNKGDKEKSLSFPIESQDLESQSFPIESQDLESQAFPSSTLRLEEEDEAPESFHLSLLETQERLPLLGKPQDSSIRQQLGFGNAGHEASLDNLDELYDLCSGKWSKPSTMNKESDVNASCELDSTDTVAKKGVALGDFCETTFNTQENMDELFGLCSGKFGGKADQADVGKESSSTALVNGSGHRSDDELSISSLHSETFSKRNKKTKRIVSDSEDDDRLSEDQENEEKEEEEEEEEESCANKMQIQNFFEDEAELSGSDVPSDEDEEIAENDDILEEELGDCDEFSDEELKDQLGKVHLKMMMDEDQKRLRIYKEMYLEDGDLHSEGPGRTRKFRWRNVDEEASNDDGPKRSDSENEEADDAVDREFRLKRYEREKWLSEQKKLNGNQSILESDVGSMLAKKKITIFDRNSQELKLQQPEKNQTDSSAKKKITNLRGSFLAKSKDMLEKFAGITKGAEDSSSNGPNGPWNSKNFVFTVVSPPKAQPSPVKTRKPTLGQTGPAAKKARLENKFISSLDYSNDSNSIFDLLKNK